MRFDRWVTALALIAALGLAADARAQTGYVEGFGGVLIVDDGELGDASIDPAAMFGAVIGYAVRPGWEVMGAYAYSPVTVTSDEGGVICITFPCTTAVDVDASVHAYFGAVNYILPTETTAKFLLTAGIGGLTVSPDVEGVDSSNDLLVNFGGSVRFMATDRIAIQGAVRDHVQFCKGLDEGENKVSLCPLDDTTLHHIEVSGGVLVLF